MQSQAFVAVPVEHRHYHLHHLWHDYLHLFHLFVTLCWNCSASEQVMQYQKTASSTHATSGDGTAQNQKLQKLKTNIKHSTQKT